jgi:hypothetical protein
MAQRLPEPQPTFTVVDLLAGYFSLGVFGWILGGILGVAVSWGWTAGSRVGLGSGIILFTLLVVRTIWLAMHAVPSRSSPGSEAEPGAATDDAE